MKKRSMWKIIGYLLLVVGFFSIPATPAQADIAPPDFPPGTNILPGDENTQVRMEAETVVLAVLENTSGPSMGQAKVTATFTMRNLGEVEERMQVRFPLTFWNGASNGFMEYPEIRDLQVKVNGIPEGTIRVTTPNTWNSEGPDVPWAAFQVVFPPGEAVSIQVTYTQDAMGELAMMVLRYVLETGAGWKGTIGSAELILRLPYEANRFNIIFDEEVGFGTTTQGGVLQGNELRWFREDFEPQEYVDNLEVALIVPAVWRSVLQEQKNVKDDPNDGEAWGRLGKAYKEVIGYRRGYRTDPGGLELYQLSLQAYQECLRLLPQDSLWHFGYADLLWQHWLFHVHFSSVQDYRELVTALTELQTALQIDPNNQRARDLLLDISYYLPEYVRQTDSGFDLLILTATPLPFTSTPTVEFSPTPAPTETLLPTNTPLAQASAPSATPPPPTEQPNLAETKAAVNTAAARPTDLLPSPAPTQTPGPRLPCGSLGLIPLLGVLVWRRQFLRRGAPGGVV